MSGLRLAATFSLLVAWCALSAARAEESPVHRARELPLSGDLRAHDPALARDHGSGDWFVFSTGDPAIAGGTLQIRRSSDLRNWTYAGNVFDALPAWIVQSVPGVSNAWAPEVFEHDGAYYLYYAASTFGSNRSVIALATNTTLDPDDPAYAWVDRGLVTESTSGDDFNAIDPAIVQDDAGTPHLFFGSFWSGIRSYQLLWPDGKLAPDQIVPKRIADRMVPPNAIESASLTRHAGYYYLFVSFDFCCRGIDSTYKIAVGRSRDVSGPFLDRLGTPLMHGGGTVLLSERGTMFGPGGESIYGGWLIHHYYDGTEDGAPRMALRRIGWDAEGWPVIADTER